MTTGKNKIQRGEIYWINLESPIGSEIQKTRPCLVVSNNKNNEYSSTVTIIPLTSKKLDFIFPFEVFIAKGILEKDSKAKTDQIRTIDKSRIQEFIGVLDIEILEKINKAMKIQLDLN